MNRPSVDAWMMGHAHQAALRGTCTRLQVGAVIAHGSQILALGYNGSPPGWPHCDELPGGCAVVAGHCENTIHAEANALMRLPQVVLPDLTLYCSAGVPCLRCCLLAAGRGITRIVAPTHSYIDQRAEGLGFPDQRELLTARGIEVVLLGQEEG